MNYYTLKNDIKIPSIGFGTWKTPDGDVAEKAVLCALENGYRHIDTAAIYGNEVSIGKALKKSNIKREDLFITSKVWNSHRGYQNTLDAFEKTLSDLQLDYLDLYLIHWPANAKQFANFNDINMDTWRAMMEIYKSGKAKAIGVSNFKMHHLLPLMECEVTPMVNQIELHPGMNQDEMVSYCQANGIIVEAWSPLGNGRLLQHPTLLEIAGKYQKSIAQICIRWCLQKGLLPLPKSVTPSRIIENLDVNNFELSVEDMTIINQLEACGQSGSDPDLVDF